MEPSMVLWGYFLYMQWVANPAQPEVVTMPPITVVYNKDDESECEEAREWFKANRPTMDVSDCVPQYAPMMQDEQKTSQRSHRAKARAKPKPKHLAHRRRASAAVPTLASAAGVPAQ